MPARKFRFATLLFLAEMLAMTSLSAAQGGIVRSFNSGAARTSSLPPLSILANLDGCDPGQSGVEPLAALAQGRDGNFYGSASACSGTLFRISPAGGLTLLHTFCSEADCDDGYVPRGNLVLSTDDYFYGTTYGGGGWGNVFKTNADGALTPLYEFCQGRPICTDGALPYAGLVQAADGNFYGTTFAGGKICATGASGCGTVFKITPAGTLTTLHEFCSQAACADGVSPAASLIQASDGNLYGTTVYGGDLATCSGGCGVIFKITTSGTLTTVHTFGILDGQNPWGPLFQANDGSLYGITLTGGKYNAGGTIFRITTQGLFTVLYSFCGVLTDKGYCADGGASFGGLVEATDGNLYGATSGGGFFDSGVLFDITLAGTYTRLHSFCNECPGGARYPAAGLVQGTDGIFYGTTSQGGPVNDGTIFSLDVGLDPFITFVQGTGAEGETAQILGQGFTGATSVAFNGIPAAFSVASDTFLTAVVPAGATSGPVTVTTTSGTLTSYPNFTVTK